MDYLSLCLICKDENDYLPEWLDYHILLGVDRFYIYDNDSRIGLRNYLKGYIERNWVVVVDIHGEAMQLYAYEHCLKTFGSLTFWLGFIDTDEFLVPKKHADLKTFLKEYEPYGGVAVSSLFFGSSGQRTRPAEGQIAAYTYRTHQVVRDNELVKSIVQPRWTLFPNSPHDFTYKEDHGCVNENFFRVDGQRFPNFTNKIQLNHYYCRSEQEIDQKLQRGNSGAIPWPRKRFDTINAMATYEDTCILQVIKNLITGDVGNELDAPWVLTRMNDLARSKQQNQLDAAVPVEANDFAPKFIDWVNLRVNVEIAKQKKDYHQVHELLLLMIKVNPADPLMFVNMAVNYLNMGDPGSAWGAISHAWDIGRGSYDVLAGMAYYFLCVNDHGMAEKTSHLLMEIAPQHPVAFGFLTQALIGQERFEDALVVGLPMVELSSLMGGLPNGTDLDVIKMLAGQLQRRGDEARAKMLLDFMEGLRSKDDYPGIHFT